MLGTDRDSKDLITIMGNSRLPKKTLKIHRVSKGWTMESGGKGEVTVHSAILMDSLRWHAILIYMAIF